MADNSEDKREQLSQSVKLIVATRERTPRNPRWAAAWRRTLFRYVDELRRLHRNSEPIGPAQTREDRK